MHPFVTGRSHILLGERSLSFNNVMISLTSTRLGAHIVELGSALFIDIEKAYDRVNVGTFGQCRYNRTLSCFVDSFSATSVLTAMCNPDKSQ